MEEGGKEVDGTLPWGGLKRKKGGWDDPWGGRALSLKGMKEEMWRRKEEKTRMECYL